MNITSMHVITGSGYSRLEYVESGRLRRVWYYAPDHHQRATNAAKVLRFAVCGF